MKHNVEQREIIPLYNLCKYYNIGFKAVVIMPRKSHIALKYITKIKTDVYIAPSNYNWQEPTEFFSLGRDARLRYTSGVRQPFPSINDKVYQFLRYIYADTKFYFIQSLLIEGKLLALGSI